MEHYFHIDLNDENYLTQIQNMVNQLQTSINTYQQSSNPSQNQENYLIQFEFDVQVPQQNSQENLPNYFKNCAEIDQELGPALYIQKKDPILDKNECLICMEKFEYKKYKRILKCCNNIYHKKCIDKWLKKNSSCPTCRYDFLNKDSKSNEEQTEPETNDENINPISNPNQLENNEINNENNT